jgi:hypothetical protein
MEKDLKIEYTIERHLNELCLQNTDFEILNAVWKLNKKKIGLGLNNVSSSFPHYSLHDRSHSNTIIRNIESFLDEERIRKLSPSDSFLILMAAYTHDIGMILLHSIIQREWTNSEFEDFLISTKENSNDVDLIKSAKLILDFAERCEKSQTEDLGWALEVKNAVILLTADFFRRTHHSRSKDYISVDNNEFKRIAQGFYSDQLPNRFLDLLGEIAYAHGISFLQVLNNLDYQADGFQSDKIHPRFIAFLIRLGDLLDVDDNRFDDFSLNQLSKIPDTSFTHKEKHASVKHILISPQSIEARVDCKNEDVYRTARQWFDWLIAEVGQQSKEWALIAPSKLGGLPPVILNGKIQILYKGALPKKELLDLKFTISNQRIFEIFEGAALYDDAEFVFLREIVQNSIDATKIQIWKDISSGIYDFILRPHLQGTYVHLKDNSDFDVISNIKFPDDIPNDIYMNYPITLSIDWDKTMKDELNIICKDNGTGISEENLIRMTRKVGESRKNDKSYQIIKNSLPFWLRPTGAFGIGLQSLFILSDSFIIQTKADNENPKEVIFRSAKKQNYCSITDNEPEIKRGTRLILKIHKDRFSKIFKNSFSFDIIDSYDYYTDKKGSIYLYKMQDYLLNELENIEYLNINLLDEGRIKNAEQKSTSSELKYIASKLTSDFHEKLISYETKESLPFIVYESNIIGSEIYLNFINSFDFIDLEYIQPHYKYLYFVRDIPVKDNTYGFYKSHYFGLIWNLLSPESDKILSLSRNKLISKTKYSLNAKLLYEVFPRIMPSIKSLFEDNFNNYSIKESNKACIYFHILLSCIINENRDVIIKKSILAKLKIPSLLIESIDNKEKEILATDFFELKKLLVVSGSTFGVNNKQKFQIKQTIYNSIKDECKEENVNAIIWANQYFDVYLRWNYQVIKIFKKDNNGSVFILEKNISKEFKPVEVDDNTKEQILLGLAIGRHVSANRQNIYAIEPYCNILAVENTYKGGFELFPYLSSHSILSPFKNKKQADEILEDLNKVNLTGEDLSDYVYKKHIDILITDKIVENILENRSMKNAEINEAIIKREYSRLIVDFFKATKDESPVPNKGS